MTALSFAAFVHDLDGFSTDEIELVMRTNGLSLTQRSTVAA